MKKSQRLREMALLATKCSASTLPFSLQELEFYRMDTTANPNCPDILRLLSSWLINLTFVTPPKVLQYIPLRKC